MRVREARARLRLQLVRGQVLGLEREGLGEVAFEVGGALAGDPVDEVERDVVESGIAQDVERHAGRRRGRATRSSTSSRCGVEALRADRHTVDTVSAQKRGELGRHRLRIRLDGHLARRPGSAASSRSSAAGSVKVGVPPPRKIVSSRGAAPARARAREQRVDVAPVLAAGRDGDEVAVAAAMRAERQVDVEMRAPLTRVVRPSDSSPPQFGQTARLRAADGRTCTRTSRSTASPSTAPRRSARTPRASRGHYFFPSLRFSTARNASCGTSTAPTCFIRFLPSFCFSSSLRLRVMSPP